MARASVISPHQQFYYEGTNIPIAAGRVYFYTSDDDLARIYVDPDLKIPQENPYTLDAGGMIRGDVRFPSTLSLSVESPSGEALYDIDEVSCFSDETPFVNYSPIVIYSMGDLVTASNGNYYRSKIDGNLNNNPPTNAVAWEIAAFIPGDAGNIALVSELVPYNQSLLIGAGGTWQLADLADITPNFLGGLSTATAADADHDITISSGRCNDAANSLSMALETITKRIDATWAAGTDNGGLASGATLGGNTWYHLFVVKVGNSIDAMFDSSIACANGVANNAVTHFRRIASIITDGSSNIRGYAQQGSYFFFDSMPQDYNAVVSSSDAIVVTLTTPTGVSTKALIRSASERGTTAGATTYLLISSTASADSVPSASIYSYAMEQNAANTDKSLTIEIDTDTSSAIRIRRAGIVAITVRINTIGYIDTRGQ